jgi:hypothetical protein
MACPGENWIVPGANPCANAGNSIAGVESLNGEVGTVDIVAGDSSMIVTAGGGQVTLRANIGGNVVNTLNYMIGDLVIQSANNSISVVEDILTKKIDLKANFPSTVTSFNTINGPVTLTPTDGSITVTNDIAGKNVNLKANFPAILSTVTSVNTIKGDMTLTSTDGSLTLTGNTLTKNINFKANFPAPPVIPSTLTSLNGIKGIATLTSSNASVTITNTPGTSNIDLAVPPVNIGVGGITIQGGTPVLTGTVLFQGTGATTVGYSAPNNITVDTLAVQSLNPGNNTGSVTLTSTDNSITITSPGGGTINFSSPAVDDTNAISFCYLFTQFNSFGNQSQSLPNGAKIFINTTQDVTFVSAITKYTRLSCVIGIPYSSANNFGSGSVRWGLTWGNSGALPPDPTSQISNFGLFNTVNSGLIGTFDIPCSDLAVPPPGATTLYFFIANITGNTLIINELPPSFLLIFK